MSTPSPTSLPAHVAIIMDGNRRWAKKRFMPAGLGHAAGAKRVREVVRAGADGLLHLPADVPAKDLSLLLGGDEEPDVAALEAGLEGAIALFEGLTVAGDTKII